MFEVISSKSSSTFPISPPSMHDVFTHSHPASSRRQATTSTASSQFCGTHRSRVCSCLHLRLQDEADIGSYRLVEIRASQRTFEGAYIRTAIGQFSFALIVLKIFTREFYSIGALFATYGAGILMVSVYRRYEGNRQFFSEIGDDGMGRKKFRTSGNAVVVLTALSMVAYATLIVLTVRLSDNI